MSEDTTVWQRVKRPRLPEGVPHDRRSPPPTDYLKWLPLIIVVATGFAGHITQQVEQRHLQEKVAAQAAYIDKLERRQAETDKAQWQQISRILHNAGLPPNAQP